MFSMLTSYPWPVPVQSSYASSVNTSNSLVHQAPRMFVFSGIHQVANSYILHLYDYAMLFIRHLVIQGLCFALRVSTKLMILV